MIVTLLAAWTWSCCARNHCSRCVWRARWARCAKAC